MGMRMTRVCSFSYLLPFWSVMSLLLHFITLTLVLWLVTRMQGELSAQCHRH
jgi:hypothetical protein